MASLEARLASLKIDWSKSEDKLHARLNDDEMVTLTDTLVDLHMQRRANDVVITMRIQGVTDAKDSKRKRRTPSKEKKPRKRQRKRLRKVLSE